ncbi:DUF3613 domain-containing protein [Glaciimonas sp. Gout2]|uniref:DUF3613 domain-containing protein n=1 Tax=unclassified Glaciimonas TaxID=2644401 RepID=UPI002B23B034|nr:MULTISPECIES: DUF3613 domain-containing protein [unclassified Glaciimonas]MEB0013062.1 DUF3613 domain-containing protein [Glaciimonas sp. Cout2]MEB0083629.1 DUF3613 domain-containing protein [Glaciimonas sp. Gout2]
MRISQLSSNNPSLTRNGVLFLLLAMVFLPVLHAQTNAPVTGRMVQSGGKTAPIVPAQTSAVETTGATINSPAPNPQVAADASLAAAPVSTQPELASGPEPEPSRTRVGDVTRSLLQAQVDGRVAGSQLPMLGVTAEASWERYMNSFTHPLPEFFEAKVAKSTTN